MSRFASSHGNSQRRDREVYSWPRGHSLNEKINDYFVISVCYVVSWWAVPTFITEFQDS